MSARRAHQPSPSSWILWKGSQLCRWPWATATASSSPGACFLSLSAYLDMCSLSAVLVHHLVYIGSILYMFLALLVIPTLSRVTTRLAGRIGKFSKTHGLSGKVRRCSKSHGSGRVGSGSFSNLTGRVGSDHPGPIRPAKSQGSGRVTLTRSNPREEIRPVESLVFFCLCVSCNAWYDTDMAHFWHKCLCGGAPRLRD